MSRAPSTWAGSATSRPWPSTTWISDEPSANAPRRSRRPSCADARPGAPDVRAGMAGREAGRLDEIGHGTPRRTLEPDPQLARRPSSSRWWASRRWPSCSFDSRMILRAISALLDQRTLGLLGRTILLGRRPSSRCDRRALRRARRAERTCRRRRPAHAGRRSDPGAADHARDERTMVLDTPGPVMCALILGFATFRLVSPLRRAARRSGSTQGAEAARLVGGACLRLRPRPPARSPCGTRRSSLELHRRHQRARALPDYVSAVGRKFNVYAGEVFSPRGRQGMPAPWRPPSRWWL